ncbi:hypothetical protein Pcinc_022564 [Petrolisthes cinctipes]|uniref:THAP-type domain-containing protein n=1 Tax=Petrolisthes cinctipes TaxID=88211 RepID=A0AAE1KGJ6_PETCI|nr:hypothetical protein Pcinc_022564 [Petrolisthes cinctipes]
MRKGGVSEGLWEDDGKLNQGKGGHTFPQDPEMAKIRVLAVRRQDWSPSKFSVVCKKHFSPEDYQNTDSKKIQQKLKKTAVPSYFKWTICPSSAESNSKATEEAVRSQQRGM